MLCPFFRGYLFVCYGGSNLRSVVRRGRCLRRLLPWTLFFFSSIKIGASPGGDVDLVALRIADANCSVSAAITLHSHDSWDFWVPWHQQYSAGREAFVFLDRSDSSSEVASSSDFRFYISFGFALSDSNDSFSISLLRLVKRCRQWPERRSCSEGCHHRVCLWFELTSHGLLWHLKSTSSIRPSKN